MACSSCVLSCHTRSNVLQVAVQLFVHQFLAEPVDGFAEQTVAGTLDEVGYRAKSIATDAVKDAFAKLVIVLLPTAAQTKKLFVLTMDEALNMLDE